MRKSRTYLIILILCVLFSNSVFFPVNRIYADSGRASIKPANDLSGKIDPKLNELFEQSQSVTYLVKMKEQTDTGAAANKALEKAALQKATPAASKQAARSAVVSSLMDTAAQSQFSLENYLSKMKSLGKVQSYKSFFIVNMMAVTSSKDVMEAISQRTEVEKIVPNETRELQENTEQEPPKSAGHATTTNAGQAEDNADIEWNIKRIEAPEVWAKGIDGSGIVVANLDTGVDFNHPALQRKWRAMDENGQIVHPELSWYDAASGSALPEDNNGHGTHTMGTMVGSEPDGTNQIGVAPGAKWIAVRIFNPKATDAMILDGAQWLIAPRDQEGNLHPELAPDIINNSWGNTIGGFDEWFRPMVQAWRDAQILPVFSAGNASVSNPPVPGSAVAPGNYPESYTVGAVDAEDHLGSFSLRGPSPYEEVKPEISAPGVEIRSSIPNGAYRLLDGTSMAAPHTAGLAALLLQANHSLTVDQLEEIITQTATPKTDEEFPMTPNNGYGAGIINALDAVNSIQNGYGSVSGEVVTDGSDTVPPVIEHTPVTAGFANLVIPIVAHITDEVSVQAVNVFARKSGTDDYKEYAAQKRVGDYKDGTYAAYISSDLVQPEGVDYYIEAADYGGNITTTDTYHVELTAGIQKPYEQDFENGFTGFTTGGTGKAWEWGTPVSGPGKAFSGDKVFATNLKGTYDSNSSAYLMAPPIDLSGTTDLTLLTFKQWYDIEDYFDAGTVYVSAASTHDEFVPVRSFTGASYGWNTAYIDLSPYLGETVTVMFSLTSDEATQKSGWYIDDFKLQSGDQTAPGAPTDLFGMSDQLGHVNLSWSDSLDEDLKNYLIYRSQDPDNDYEQIATATSATYDDYFTATEATYYYKVQAEDYSGNLSPYSEPFSLFVEAPGDLYSDNFDSEDDNGWTHSGMNDEWQRGKPNQPILNRAVSPPNVWGTSLNDFYHPYTQSYLYSPVIDLSSTAEASLLFKNWYSTELEFDFGAVEASIDGGSSWSTLLRFTGDSFGWGQVIYDLKNYVGHPVQFRFHFKADGNYEYPGWFIDDFRITDKAPPEGLQTVDRKLDKQMTGAKRWSGPLFNMAGTSILSTESGQPDSAAWKEIEPSSSQASGSLNKLPLAATVTVLETGRSVSVDPYTGQYAFNHPAGDFTLKAEAYGYYPQTQSARLTDKQTVQMNFNLQKIPSGQVHGIITDERTGEPVAKALVKPLGDARVPGVQTGEDGSFAISLLEGDAQLQIQADQYYPQTLSIQVAGGKEILASAKLKPFIGISKELAYDDGNPDIWLNSEVAGDAMAVRYSPDSPVTQITGIKIMLMTDLMFPGGKEFEYAIYDASGQEGTPGTILGGPYQAEASQNQGWTTVLLPEPVTLHGGDFYIVYFQSQQPGYSPVVGIDTTTAGKGRMLEKVSGSWVPFRDAGSIMLRAQVSSGYEAPVLMAPAKDTYTPLKEVTVQGTSFAEGAPYKLYNNDSVIGTGNVENGAFSQTIKLNPGRNIFTAETSINGKWTDRSEPVTVTLDEAAPVLTVTKPEDGQNLNVEMTHVTGTVKDEYLKELLVNGSAAEVRQDGSFDIRIFLNPGDNLITVTAIDLAGNETTITRTVKSSSGGPQLTHIQPDKDVYLTAGSSFAVSFDSAPGLTAAFRIELPSAANKLAGNGIPMKETKSGHYEGTYYSDSSLKMNGGRIVITAADTYGNTVDAAAPGKLYVSSSNSGGGGTPPAGGGGNGSGGGAAPSPGPSPSPAPVPTPTPSPEPTPAPVQTPPPAGTAAPVFKDLAKVKWAQSAIEELAGKGILKGTDAHTFSPLKEVTRAEFTAMLVRVFQLGRAEDSIAFKDVKAGAWYQADLAAAVQAGIVHGTGMGQFEPNRSITREEMAVMTANALKQSVHLSSANPETTFAAFKDRNQVSAYAIASVSQLLEAGLLQGTPNNLIAPKGLATRAEAAVLLQRLLNQMPS